MGYWEQIAKANRRHNQKRAAMHPLRRRLMDILGEIFLYGTAIVLWAILLAPLWISSFNPAD